MRLLYLIFGFLLVSAPVAAETIRGGIDCKITDQHYMRISPDQLQSSKGRAGGDGIGATLHLRYEITRPLAGQPFAFKIEYGRFDILFDETYPASRLKPILNAAGKPVGLEAISPKGTVTTNFQQSSITLSRQNARLTLQTNEGDKITGLYQASRLQTSNMTSHVMGLTCTHKTDAIQQILDQLFAT